MRLASAILPLGLFPSASALHRYKFEQWFPYYDYHWTAASLTCAAQIEAYRTDNRTLYGAPCASVVDCLLSNTTESIKANLASAGIFLGLTPAILIFAGPSVGDIAVLSTFQPTLATFLSLGFPFMLVTDLFRAFKIDNILDRTVSKTARKYNAWLEQQKASVKGLMKGVLWGVATGAIANNIYTSMYTDMRTASGWRCSAEYMPLAWSVSGVMPAVVNMIAIRTRRVPGTTRKQGWFRGAKSKLPGCMLPGAQDGVVTELVFWLATLLTVAQMVYGTVIFSSLRFVSFLDAIPILVRFGVSASLCHLVFMVELSGLRTSLQTRKL